MTIVTPSHRPDYAEGRPIRRRRRIRRVVAAVTILISGAAVYAVRHGAVDRVRLLYWQHRCAVWDGPVIAPATTYAPVARPACYLALRSAMTAVGWRPGPKFADVFLTDPIVFLHERTSPAGHRRIICMDFRPNVDHSQLCSVDCFVLTPATLTSMPAATSGVTAWVEGWSTHVQWGGLRPAVADPADASHFVFRYDEVRCKVTTSDDPLGFDVEGKRPDQLTVATHTLDGWLRDDGTVDIVEQPDGPPFDPASTRPVGQ